LFNRNPNQTWTDYLRQLLAFALGGVLIVHAAFFSGAHRVPELVIGLLLMGLVPVDVVLRKLGLGNGQAGPSEPAPPPADSVEPSG
jgi:hypothetical protein